MAVNPWPRTKRPDFHPPGQSRRRVSRTVDVTCEYCGTSYVVAPNPLQCRNCGAPLPPPIDWLGAVEVTSFGGPREFILPDGVVEVTIPVKAARCYVPMSPDVAQMFTVNERRALVGYAPLPPRDPEMGKR